jgi:hypothetical protein
MELQLRASTGSPLWPTTKESYTCIQREPNRSFFGYITTALSSRPFEKPSCDIKPLAVTFPM